MKNYTEMSANKQLEYIDITYDLLTGYILVN